MCWNFRQMYNHNKSEFAIETLFVLLIDGKPAVTKNVEA